MGETSGSGMNVPDHFFESLETFFGIKILDSLLLIRIQDPGSRIFLTVDPGSGINIPDPQHW
jgi:hypothetical protein